MATKPPTFAEQQQLTPEQMRAALPKLNRRLEELQAFDPKTATGANDTVVSMLETKLKDTIGGIFGMSGNNWTMFQPGQITPLVIKMGYTNLRSEIVATATEGKARQVANLQTIIELFNEKLADAQDDPAGRAKRAFGDLDLHPEIERASAQLFHDGHYANAVEDACKALDLLVKLRSMRTDPSGTELMQLVFSPNAPILKFNDQQNESEKSEQRGMMFLFSGAMLALRNPRAHGITNDHPERAVEYLSFLSMLARSLDRTQRT
jgi:uncharacterized protein (TIGR02391 family)